MSKIVLGKGLEALIPGQSALDQTNAQYQKVTLDRIAPNPKQPRHEFTADALHELAESVKRNGIIQPLIVKNNGSGYVIIAGERRYRAARLAELEKVPVVVMDDVDDNRMLELALIENIHREDLNPIETALAYRKLITDCELTQNELSIRIGKSRTAVTNQIRLLSLPEKIQEMIRSSQLSEGHARAILGLENEPRMLEMADQIVSDSLSVRQVEHTARTRKRGRRAVRRNSPGITEIENSMKQILGTSVKIIPGAKRGRIEVEYYGDDDLERIWELMRTFGR